MGHISCWYYLLILLAIPYTTSGIKIGGLFDYDTEDVEFAFNFAVEILNKERQPNSAKLESESVKIPFGDEFPSAKKLCRLLKNDHGIAAVFGPKSPQTAVHVKSICDAKEMPHIETRSDVYTQQPTINLHPHPHTIQRIFIDLINAFEWEQFTILYESAPWLSHVQDLLKMYDHRGYTITVRQLDLKMNDNYRNVLRRIKRAHNNKIILECSIDILPEVLKQAQQVGLLTDHHHFIIASFDFHTIDLEPYQYSGTNFTGMRLVNPNDENMQEAAELFKTKQEGEGMEVSPGLTAEFMRTETALMFDAVLLFNEAIQQLNFTKRLKTVSLQCKDDETWKYGYSIINFMKSSTIRGLTRDIKFDHMGHRTDFLLDLVEVTKSGLQQIGNWNSTTGLNISRAQESFNSSRRDEGLFSNKTFNVITALSAPYGMLTNSPIKLNGNDRFEGFGIELIYELSVLLGFNYSFVLQEDGNYGSLDKSTGKWGGMMNEIMEGRADFGITDLTITSDRESAVDFTMPFMNLGIQILYKKPTKAAPSLFSFLSPFSNEVWLYLGGAYFGVSLTLFVLGRISPNEWDNPNACIEDPVILENQFSKFSNALWFSIGALLQQGTEIAPKSPSTRTVASIWWFFTLIMVSSYTANLAAFLTVESTVSIIDSAEDLANKNGQIKYGAKEGGSTFSFFKDSDYEVYKKMYSWMSNNTEYSTKSNDEGLKRVQSENYAFIMESTSIEYYTERNCDVSEVGGLLDDKGYGIAMKKNSPYRAGLSEAVLRLQEQGKLTSMKTKWWKEKRGGGACSKGSGGNDAATALGMDNLGGVFLVVCCGGVLAVAIQTFQNFYIIFKTAKQHKVPFKQELIAELKFVVRCTEMTKQVRHRKSSSSSRQSQDRTSGSFHSRNSCTPGRDMINEYGFKFNEKNGKKEELNLKAII